MANLATLLYAMGFFAMLLGNILFLTSVWHYSILVAGLAVTPGPLVVAVVSGPAGKLAGRIGFRPVLLVGFAVFASALVWYALRVGVHREYLTVWLPATLVAGLGIGLTFPVLSAAAVSTCTPSGSPSAAPSTRRRDRWVAHSGWPCLVVLLGTPVTPTAGARQLPPPVVVRGDHGGYVGTGVRAPRRQAEEDVGSVGAAAGRRGCRCGFGCGAGGLRSGRYMAVAMWISGPK